MDFEELLRVCTPESIRETRTHELEGIVREISMLPKRSSFPLFDRLHERAALIDRELQSRRTAYDETQVERRHTDLFEHAQSELSISIEQHRQTLRHSRRSARVAALIAAIAAIAAMAAAWYSRVQALSAVASGMHSTPGFQYSLPTPTPSPSIPQKTTPTAAPPQSSGDAATPAPH